MFSPKQLVICAISLGIGRIVAAIPAPQQASEPSSIPDGRQNLTVLSSSNPKVPAPPPSTSPSVLYTWSDDKDCASTATKASCAAAFAHICTTGKLDQSVKHTVEECTVWYWVDAKTKIPSSGECVASFAKIHSTSNGFGSLGYDDKGARTVDPMYAVYPKYGNGNCFKAPGDTSPVLPMDVLPNGKTSLKTCGAKNTQRDLQERGTGYCLVENLTWQAFCNGVCLTTVVSTSWLTGPFAVAGWLACLGGCDYTGYVASDKCLKAAGLEGLPGVGDKVKRDDPQTPVDKCGSLEKFSFQCPAWKHGISRELGCTK